VPVSLPTVPVSSVPTPVSSTTQSIPVPLPAVPVSDFSSNSFSLPLYNVFDRIERASTDELASDMPVLEKVVFPVAHVDVHSVEVEQSHQTSREELENPTVTVVTNPLLDSVKNNHVNLRELEESPIDSIERASHSSPLGREDVRPDGVEQMHQTLREELEIPVMDDNFEPLRDGVEHDHVSPRELEKSPKGARESVTRPSTIEHVDMHEELATLPLQHVITPTDHSIVSTMSLHNMADVSVGSQAMETSFTEASNVFDGEMISVKDQIEILPQRQEVHPSKNIQHGLELWNRVREYDARSAAEASAGLLPVLTRNLKNKLKVQHVLQKQPTKSRARDDTHPDV
jgi:hypothetical protein